MKYTKKQRNEIYKGALKSSVDNGLGSYICFRILSVCGHYPSCHDFPEFYLFKPKKSNDNDVWYGYYSGFEIRQTVLEFCIYMTS